MGGLAVAGRDRLAFSPQQHEMASTAMTSPTTMRRARTHRQSCVGQGAGIEVGTRVCVLRVGGEDERQACWTGQQGRRRRVFSAPPEPSYRASLAHLLLNPANGQQLVEQEIGRAHV